jgi:hypothetical protein
MADSQGLSSNESVMQNLLVKIQSTLNTTKHIDQQILHHTTITVHCLVCQLNNTTITKLHKNTRLAQ